MQRIPRAVPAFLVPILWTFPTFAQGPISLFNLEPNGNDGGFPLNGFEFSGDLGMHVSAIGDMNGDGFEDFISSAIYADVVAEAEGQSYVLFGSTSGDAVNATSIVGGTRGFVINGVDNGDLSGWAPAGVGDVNGDGIPDVAMQTKNPDFDDDDGHVWVVFGKSSGTAVSGASITAGTGGFVIDGGDGDQLGWTLDGLGDMNGDGFDDLAIGAPGNGFVYVVFGKSNTTAVDADDLATGAGGFRIFPTPFDIDIGRLVSGAGDVNGDGIPDLLIGDDFESPNSRAQAGITYVVFGKIDNSNIDLDDIIAGAGGFAVSGARAGDSSGGNAAGAGDVNGDGLGDIIIGARGVNPSSRNDAGAAYVVFGKTNTTAVDLLDVEAGTGGFVINGAFANGFAGTGVSSAGDVNGDGLADLVVGANEATGVSAPGRVYVVYGKASGTSVDLLNVEANTGGYAIHATDVGGDFGMSVDSADVNGDGKPDVIAGGPNQDVLAAADEGRVWTIFNPLSLSSSAMYQQRTRIGDGASGTVVPPTRFRDARATIDFPNDDTADNGAGAASTESVTLTRSGSSITNLPIRPARVRWLLASNRAGSASAVVTLRYTPAEVSHLVESSLRLYQAPTIAGPWTDITDALNTGRNEISGEVTSFGHFAIGGDSILPNDETWVDFDFVGQEQGTQVAPFNTIHEGAQFIEAGGTINIFAGTTPENVSIAKPMTLVNEGPGIVRIGDESSRSAERTAGARTQVGFVAPIVIR